MRSNAEYCPHPPSPGVPGEEPERISLTRGACDATSNSPGPASDLARRYRHQSEGRKADGATRTIGKLQRDGLAPRARLEAIGGRCAVDSLVEASIRRRMIGGDSEIAVTPGQSVLAPPRIRCAAIVFSHFRIAAKRIRGAAEYRSTPAWRRDHTVSK